MSSMRSEPDRRKRLAAGALIRNHQGEILIVKPIYRDGWLIPGGAVEAGESPLVACTREVREELGLQLVIRRLLCIEYQSTDGFGGENLQFIFDGGVLTPAQMMSIQLPPDELADARFVAEEEAVRLLVPRLARRLPFVLEAYRSGGTAYLEDGQAVGVSGVPSSAYIR
jgi:8-oxo-dGTP diphosphatase